MVQERLNWKLAQHDDTRVAQGLYAGEEIEEMHQLSDAGLLDEFFVYLEEIGMLEVFEQVVLPEVKRILVSTAQFVLLYFLKVHFGSESMNELPRVLFSDLALMGLVAFNAQECAEGLTKRGEAMRKMKKKQGPITPQCLAEPMTGAASLRMAFSKKASISGSCRSFPNAPRRRSSCIATLPC
jgi:hypothetical protein